MSEPLKFFSAEWCAAAIEACNAEPKVVAGFREPAKFSHRMEFGCLDTGLASHVEWKEGIVVAWGPPSFPEEDLWLKMAMEMDERKKTRMVSVRTIGTSDDNNHDVVEAKSVYMKISSDTKTVGFYYSLDNKTWQLIRLFRNDYPASIWLGISAQSPLGNGTSAVFEDMSLTRKSISDFRLGI